MGHPKKNPSDVSAVRSSDSDDDIDFGDDSQTAPRPAEPPSLPSKLSEGPLAGLLGPLLKRPGALRGGAVFVLCLQDVRRRLGARWDSVCERLYRAVEAAFDAELAPGDALVRLGGHRYLLAFAPDEPKAGERAAGMARKVKEKLFGATADVAVNVLPYGPDGLEPPALHEETEFGFVPVWDAQHRILSSHHGMPVHVPRSGRPRFEQALLPFGASDVEIATFDAHTLQKVVDVVDALNRSGITILISFSVDYRSLGSSRSREVFVAACQRIPKLLRSRIVAEIADVPRAVPPSTLAERVGLIKPFFRELFLETPALEEQMSRLSYLGLHGVLYNIWRHSKTGAIDISQAKRAAQDAKAARLQLAIGGIPDRATAHQLAAQGVSYLSGPFMGEILALPAPLLHGALDALGREAPA